MQSLFVFVVFYYIYLLSKTGSKIVGIEKYTKNHNIYNCLFGEYMCVLECIYIAVYKEKYKKLTGSVNKTIPKLKKFHKKVFNKPFPDRLNGLDIIQTRYHTD
jgi:hypothetical protein